MEDEFQGGVCGGNSWNISKTIFGSSSPCSMAVNDIGSFEWSKIHDMTMIDMKSSSCSNEDSTGSASDENIFQESKSSQQPTNIDTWNQNLLFHNGRTEENNYDLLQEATCLNSSMMNYWQETSFDDFPQIFVDSSINSGTFITNQTVDKCLQESSRTPKLSTNSSSYSCSSSFSQRLFEADSRVQKFVSPVNNLLFDNNTSSSIPLSQSRVDPSSVKDKIKPNLHSFSEKIETSDTKEAGNEFVTKRPRIETPSPLPTFKVRKEKLGDRVTALQQLVSPFGKTDTASVLHEAIEYIKFLHGQASTLTASYKESGPSSSSLQLHQKATSDHSNDQEVQKVQDLRSRGLCLVPISSTFPIAAETTSDFWTPTFAPSFRL